MKNKFLLKSQKPLFGIGAFFLVIGILFVLVSGKNPPPLTSNPSPTCDHATDDVAKIKINFPNDYGYVNIPHRKPNYENFIHDYDLRRGYNYPSNTLSSGNDSYYCTVSVTCPQCSSWTYSTKITQANGGGNGIVSFNVPDSALGHDVRIQVYYYERCGESYYTDSGLYLIYKYDHTFMGGLPTNGTQQPITLWYSGLNYCYNLGGVPPFDTVHSELLPY